MELDVRRVKPVGRLVGFVGFLSENVGIFVVRAFVGVLFVGFFVVAAFVGVFLFGAFVEVFLFGALVEVLTNDFVDTFFNASVGILLGFFVREFCIFVVVSKFEILGCFVVATTATTVAGAVVFIVVVVLVVVIVNGGGNGVVVIVVVLFNAAASEMFSVGFSL